LFTLFAVAFHRTGLIDAQSNFSETILALQRAYANEIQAHLNYRSYSEKARLENYPGIAHLFTAFAISESLHARNFKHVLSGLGVEDLVPPVPEVKVFSTRLNLKNALDFELKDIDDRYPQIHEQCKPENHEAAIRNVIYAWDSEKQHRALIRKARAGTGIFFGIFSKLIEGNPAQYFVCQVCGSTMIELPEDYCPICKNMPSRYAEVERV
jgi:rubrerythrin